MTNAEQAAHYRAKAETLRAMAKDLADEKSRFELWDVAAEYDKMAERAERRPPHLPAGMESTGAYRSGR
jgi:hypothetical protein